MTTRATDHAPTHPAPRTVVLTLALVGLALALLGTSPAAASGPTETAVGNQGELYRVVSGTWGDLFPGSWRQAADHRTLAVERVRPDRSIERHPLPDTGDGVVRSAVLHYEPHTEILYAVWETRGLDASSSLHVAGLGGDGWSDPVEISGDVAPLKGEPTILTTRDSYRTYGRDGEVATRHRTVLHVVWWERSGYGEEVYYAPILFESGTHVRWNPVVRLNDLDPNLAAPSRSVPADLARAPEIAAGEDLHSVVIGFVNPATSRLVTVESRVLPGELGFLADRFRGQIIEIGHDRQAREMSHLADEFRGQIIEIGIGAGPRLEEWVANRAADAWRQLVAEHPDAGVEYLAGRFRGQIIEIGLEFVGLARARQARQLLQIRHPDPSSGSFHHLFQLGLSADLPAPDLGDGEGEGGGAGDRGDIHLTMSEDGTDALVRWREGDRVRYQELVRSPNAEVTWSPVRDLPIEEGTDPAALEAALESRIRQR